MMRWQGLLLFSFVVLLLQMVLLNNLALSPYVAPMVYIAIIAMLPVETSQWKMLGIGLLLGVLMDLTMGTAGLNLLATLPVAYFRRFILGLLCGLSSISNEEGIPTVKRFGSRFHRYLIVVVLLHSLIFYSFEWLSLSGIGFLMLRILCSTLISLVMIYLLVIIFAKQLSRRQ